jgi:hypothetical protein
MSDGLRYFLLGTLGSLIADLLEFYQAVRALHYVIPPRYGRPGYFLAVAVRVLLGGSAAALLAAMHQVDTLAAAVTVGMSGPTVLGRLVKSPAEKPGASHG